MSVKYTDVVPQEPGYYWMTRRKFGVWLMAQILTSIDFDNKDVLIIAVNETMRPLDDFCGSVDDTFLWIGPIEKPKDLEVE